MEKIVKVFRLFFLAIIFLGLSAGYKLFGPKDATDDDQTDGGLFHFQNKAHADAPPAAASVDTGCEASGCDS